MFRRFVREEEGQTATEYMLILSVIVIVLAVAGVRYVGVFGDATVFLGHRVKWLLWTGRE